MSNLQFFLFLFLFGLIASAGNTGWKENKGYYIKLLRVVNDEWNKTLVKSVTASSFKLNRKEIVANISIEPIKPLEKSQGLDICAMMYRITAADTSLKIFTLCFDFCDVDLPTHFHGMATHYYMNGTPCVKCPVDAKFGIINYSPSAAQKKFPPYIPAGSYRMALIGYFEKKKYIGYSVSFYADIIYY